MCSPTAQLCELYSRKAQYAVDVFLDYAGGGGGANPRHMALEARMRQHTQAATNGIDFSPGDPRRPQTPCGELMLRGSTPAACAPTTADCFLFLKRPPARNKGVFSYDSAGCNCSWGDVHVYVHAYARVCVCMCMHIVV